MPNPSQCRRERVQKLCPAYRQGGTVAAHWCVICEALEKVELDTRELCAQLCEQRMAFWRTRLVSCTAIERGAVERLMTELEQLGGAHSWEGRIAMELIVTDSDGKQWAFKEGNDPFVDILDFAYSGETGFLTVGYANECNNGAPQRKTWGTGQWKKLEISQ